MLEYQATPCLEKNDLFKVLVKHSLITINIFSVTEKEL